LTGQEDIFFQNDLFFIILSKERTKKTRQW